MGWSHRLFAESRKMLHNLFTEGAPSSAQGAVLRSATSSRSASRRLHSTVPQGSSADRNFFSNCVMQVQRNLKAAATAPSLLHTLGSYYTRSDPYIDGRPFCVSLSFATFLFHMQMSRISIADTELYVQLVANVLSQLSSQELPNHPFIRMVLHDRIFGLPSPTCTGSAHCVALAAPHQYRAFRTMVTALIAMDVVPMDITREFHERLYTLCEAASPLVSNRSLGLLIKTMREVELSEQAEALRLVLTSERTKMNVDYILACFERLKRIAIDPVNCPAFVAALCIHCSEIFLRFRSPIRREYVATYLYPSLVRSDMARYLRVPEARHHLLRQLLRLCTPGLSSSNPYYLCVCALIHSCLDNETDGALEMLDLVNSHMPHAAYFIAALAVDTQMSVPMFCKMMMLLFRGAGMAMVGRNMDEVAETISESASSVYNVLYTLREVVRSCSMAGSNRSAEMLNSLRLAMPIAGVEQLGRSAIEAFDGQRDAAVDPQLLCAEIAMVLHFEHLDEAVDACVSFFKDATRQCPECGMQNSAALICPVTHALHVAGQTSAGRVLSTLSECAGSKKLHNRLIQYLQFPESQADSAVHALVFYIISHAEANTKAIYDALEPYIRGTLLSLTTRSRITSEQRANILMLHVKLISLFPERIAEDYYDSVVKVLSDIPLTSNHDGLSVWYMANVLIRHSGKHLELLPTDPLENNCCIDYPGCAPANNECAFNAQRVLKILDKAHHFSDEMSKLVGCCVCRLIQDFNLQAPNIVGMLLSSFGFMTPGLTSVAKFALPIGEHSTFWSFFLQQMRSSAPARTAFMAALAKGIGRRFRIERPSAAVTIRSPEETSHLFALMMFESIKRSPTLSRVVLFMMSNWMKQKGHPPGKFACLVYACTQLLGVIAYRSQGSSAVESEAETAADRQTFSDVIDRAVNDLQRVQPRLEKLIQVTSQSGENPVFTHLLKRIDKKLCFTCAAVNGVSLELLEESDSDVLYDVLPLQEDANEGSVNADQAGLEQGDGEGDGVPLSLHDLTNEADDAYVYEALPNQQRSAVAPHEQQQLNSPHRLPLDTEATTSKGNQRRLVDREVAHTEEVDASSSLTGKENTDLTQIGPSVTQTYHSGTADISTSNSGVDKSVTVPFAQSVGTSPIQVSSSPVDDPLKSTDDSATGGSWYEPSIFEWSGDGRPSTSSQQGGNPIQEAPIPSSIALEYLKNHQSMDSLRQEMAQMGFSSRHSELFQGQVVPQYTSEPATVMVTVPGKPNNYTQPHLPGHVAPNYTVLAPILMNSTSSNGVPGAPGMWPRVHLDASFTTPAEPGGVVDGESPLPPMSESEPEPEAKRSRLEPSPAIASGFLGAQPPQGMLQFLQRQQTGHHSAVLRELRNSFGPEEEHPGRKEVERSGVSLAPPPLLSHSANGYESPHSGQMPIPACLIEQNNDTAIQELRQAMGGLEVNTDGRPSAGRGSKGGARRSKANGKERSTSSAWWAEVSAVPMPNYATDPQYSMELF